MQRLEPIFILSADIRSQLPEDSKRFESLDAEWKDLMLDTSSNPNVVSACCKEGVMDSLKNIYSKIELCERSLNGNIFQALRSYFQPC